MFRGHVDRRRQLGHWGITGQRGGHTGRAVTYILGIFDFAEHIVVHHGMLGQEKATCSCVCEGVHFRLAAWACRAGPSVTDFKHCYEFGHCITSRTDTMYTYVHVRICASGLGREVACTCERVCTGGSLPRICWATTPPWPPPPGMRSSAGQLGPKVYGTGTPPTPPLPRTLTRGASGIPRQSRAVREGRCVGASERVCVRVREGVCGCRWTRASERDQSLCGQIATLNSCSLRASPWLTPPRPRARTAAHPLRAF